MSPTVSNVFATIEINICCINQSENGNFNEKYKIIDKTKIPSAQPRTSPSNLSKLEINGNTVIILKIFPINQNSRLTILIAKLKIKMKARIFAQLDPPNHEAASV